MLLLLRFCISQDNVVTRLRCHGINLVANYWWVQDWKNSQHFSKLWMNIELHVVMDHGVECHALTLSEMFLWIECADKVYICNNAYYLGLVYCVCRCDRAGRNIVWPLVFGVQLCRVEPYFYASVSLWHACVFPKTIDWIGFAARCSMQARPSCGVCTLQCVCVCVYVRHVREFCQNK